MPLRHRVDNIHLHDVQQFQFVGKPRINFAMRSVGTDRANPAGFVVLIPEGYAIVAFNACDAAPAFLVGIGKANEGCLHVF